MEATNIHTAALIEIYEHLIKTHEFILQLGCEVSALRESVAGLDPTFRDVMEQKRETVQSQISERSSQDLQKLRLNIELLRQFLYPGSR